MWYGLPPRWPAQKPLFQNLRVARTRGRGAPEGGKGGVLDRFSIQGFLDSYSMRLWAQTPSLRMLTRGPGPQNPSPIPLSVQDPAPPTPGAAPELVHLLVVVAEGGVGQRGTLGGGRRRSLACSCFERF